MSGDESLPEARTVAFSVVMPPAAELPLAIYANWASANHSQGEVILDFAQVALPSTEDELKALGESPVIVAKPLVRIAIPPLMLDSLIEALQKRRALMEHDDPTAKAAT